MSYNIYRGIRQSMIFQKTIVRGNPKKLGHFSRQLNIQTIPPKRIFSFSFLRYFSIQNKGEHNGRS